MQFTKGTQAPRQVASQSSSENFNRIRPMLKPSISIQRRQTKARSLSRLTTSDDADSTASCHANCCSIFQERLNIRLRQGYDGTGLPAGRTSVVESCKMKLFTAQPIIRNWAFLLLLCMFFHAGCKSPPPADLAWQVIIAKQFAIEKLGVNRVKVKSARDFGEYYSVYAHEFPEYVGSWVSVDVSKEGKILRWSPGR